VKRFPFFYGWVIVGIAALTLTLIYGVRYAFSVFYVSILDEFGWSRAATATIFSANVIVYGVTAPLFGTLLDRFGPRRLLPLGAALISLATVASSVADQIWHFYILFGVMVGLGSSAAGYVCHAAIISNWFLRYRATALGIAMSGGGAAFLVAMLVQPLIAQFGWRQAYVILGVTVGVILIPATALFQRLRPQDLGLSPDGVPVMSANPAPPPKGGTPTSHQVAATRVAAPMRDPLVVDQVWVATEWTLGRALRTRRLWLLFVASFLLWGIGLNLVLAHQVAYAVTAGYSPMLAASVFGLYGVANVLGNLCGFISDRLGREETYTLAAASAILALVALILAADPAREPFLYLYVILFGPAFGILGPTITAAMADLFGGPNFGAINGFVTAGFGLGGSLGPWLGGYIFDATDSYQLAFTISAVALGFACLLVWLAAPRRVRQVAGKVAH